MRKYTSRRKILASIGGSTTLSTIQPATATDDSDSQGSWDGRMPPLPYDIRIVNNHNDIEHKVRLQVASPNDRSLLETSERIKGVSASDSPYTNIKLPSRGEAGRYDSGKFLFNVSIENSSSSLLWGLPSGGLPAHEALRIEIGVNGELELQKLTI